MKNLRYIFLIVATFIIIIKGNFVFCQKKEINPSVYDFWNTLSNAQLSKSGNYLSYEINPHKGDGVIELYNGRTGDCYIFERAENGSFTNNEKTFVFSIKPGFDTLRTLELKKVKKEKWVKDSLGIFWMEKGIIEKHANLLDVKIAKNGNFIAYTIFKDSIQDESGKKSSKKKSKKKAIQCGSDGNTLFILNTDTEEIQVFPQVIKFDFNYDGSKLYFLSHYKEGKTVKKRVHLYKMQEKEHLMYETIFDEIGAISFSKRGNVLSFLATSDTVKETRLFDVYLWGSAPQPQKIIDNDFPGLPDGLTVSPKSNLRFSLDENRLFFGLYEKPQKKEKDTLLSSEKAELDLWHYNDNRLQPQQLKELKRDNERSLLSVYDLKNHSLTQLEDDTLSISILNQGNSDFAIGNSKERYQRTYNWSMPWPKDYYRINVTTGERQLLKENVGYAGGMTPDGRYFVFFDSPKNHFYAIHSETKEEICMTCSDSVNWKTDINGMPFEAGPTSSPGFLNKNELLLYSEFDIWKYDFASKKLVSLTDKQGEKSNTEFRIHRLDNRDSIYIDIDNVLVKGINQDSFDEAVYRFHDNKLEKLYESNHRISGFKTSKKGDKLIFRQMNTTDYPNVYLTNKNFNNPSKISDANPQQSEYVWPTVEQIEWQSYSGEELRGLLYKPDDFDETKSYPLMVYFYELYSDRKHFHYIPKPTASIVYPTEYASAGYVVFIPDIKYTPGQPGKDAYNSIMSGTDKVLELYPNIDSTRMGLQGQSWGGYQTAQLITLTNRYKAAMAGAPVSNMFSAYGGIRWASGLNRQFQYEHTQSRIGGTIWEVPELYMENSPLFGVPNIETPLLIMHNDNDGAVPWYQGIELFTAMKRLDKKVWLLQYNNEEHNLMKDKNRRDLSIRMRQFFDYYLKGENPPKWLIEGIPATVKGKEYRLELIED